MMLVRFEPAAPRSRVKHSTTALPKKKKKKKKKKRVYKPEVEEDFFVMIGILNESIVIFESSDKALGFSRNIP